MPLRIIPREDWNARSYTDIEYLNVPVLNVFSMITNTDQCYTIAQGRNAMVTLQKIHMFKTMRDIRYNFVVGSDGTVYEGRGWLIQPAILKRYKELQKSTLMVAFFWKASSGDPPDIMYEALDNIIKLGVENEFIAKKFLLHHIRQH